MDIKVFVHATDVSGDIDITLEQIDLLDETGLLDAAKEVIICTHYNENSFDTLKQSLSGRSNVVFKHFDGTYKEWYEYTTSIEVQEDCQSGDFVFLYIHNKGSFTRTIGNYNWRQYMQYFCIDKWRDCVAKLEEGYDLVGAAYSDNTKPFVEEDIHYFAGNFFWASSSYIRRCVQLKKPTEVNFQPQMPKQPHLRYDLEVWHASGKPKWFEMHEGPHERWYLPPESYRNDVFKYSSI